MGCVEMKSPIYCADVTVGGKATNGPKSDLLETMPLFNLTNERSAT